MSLTKQDLLYISRALGYTLPVSLTKSDIVRLITKKQGPAFQIPEQKPCEVKIHLTGLTGGAGVSQEKRVVESSAAAAVATASNITKRLTPVKKSPLKANPSNRNLMIEEIRMRQNLLESLKNEFPEISTRKAEIKKRIKNTFMKKYPAKFGSKKNTPQKATRGPPPPPPLPPAHFKKII